MIYLLNHLYLPVLLRLRLLVVHVHVRVLRGGGGGGLGRVRGLKGQKGALVVGGHS